MSVSGGSSLRSSAVSGGLWSLAQITANKGLSLFSTIALLYLLAPQDYAIAGIAMGIQTVAMVMPPFTLGDVLIARPTALAALLPTAIRICAAVTAVTVVALLAAGPLAASRYGEHELIAACATVALRPIVELALLGPQVRLRLGLKFRQLAVTDALTQALATLAAVAMAWSGLGWLSLLLPQIGATGLRAWIYRVMAGRGPAWSRCGRTDRNRLVRGYAVSGLGQYVHGGLLLSPPLVIAAFATTDDAGFFTTAFTLSTSINVIVAATMGMVLQPIFAQMMGDTNRQNAAFLRACGTIATVAMPLCLMQAVLAGPGFRLLLPERWVGAIEMTAVLSIGQAFFFVVNPAMSLLKARDQFGMFLLWQSVQCVLVVGGMVALGLAYGDQSALAIAAFAGLYTLVSSPIGVWLCIRSQRSALRQSVLLFLRPLAASVVAIAPTVVALHLLAGGSAASDLVNLIAVPIVAAIAYPLALRALDPDSLRELAQIASLLWLRVRRASADGTGVGG